MKKFYTTLVVLFIACLGFAQTGVKGPLKIQSEANPYKFVMSEKMSVRQDKSGEGGAWYNYPSWRQLSYSQTLNNDIVRVESDSSALVIYIDQIVGNDTTWIDGRVQFYGWGQVFDFTNSMWSDPEVIGEGSGYPDINATASYNIDSVQIHGYYTRRISKVNEDVKDTLIVSVVTGLTADQTFSRIQTIDGVTDTFFRIYDLKYNPTTDGVDETRMAPATVNHYTYILEQKDSSRIEGESMYSVRIKIPTEINNVTGKVVGMTWTFKRDKIDAHYGPGNHAPNAANRDTISKYASFFGIVYPDPNTQYSPYRVVAGETVPFFNEELKTNLNSALFIGKEEKYKLNPSGSWANERYIPTIYWNSVHEQDMYLGITCTDCEFVSVKKMEKQSVTARPNPATNNFTIDLFNDSAANIQLYNLVGQIVLNQQVNGQTSATINVADLNKGVYMLKVTQNGKVYTSKVIVK